MRWSDYTDLTGKILVFEYVVYGKLGSGHLINTHWDGRGTWRFNCKQILKGILHYNIWSNRPVQIFNLINPKKWSNAPPKEEMFCRL